MYRKNYKPTEEQKAKTEARRAKFRQLAKAVSEMTADAREQLVARIGPVPTIEGRPLSVYNSCLLISQLPSVSMVGGFNQWKTAGRIVRKGESALMIWIPKTPKSDDQAPSTQETDDQKTNFFPGSVFDISQTDVLQ